MASGTLNGKTKDKKHIYLFSKYYEAKKVQKKEGKMRKVEGRAEGEAKGGKEGEME